MKKSLHVLIGMTIVAVAGMILWGLYSLDYIVKMALEYYGPDVLGAPVKVMHVGISPKTGEGSLKELEIGTPRGFSAPRTIFVEGMKVSVDPATLMEKRVVIREIIVEQPYITYERGPAGTNLDAIQKNIEAYVKTTSTEGGDPKVARAHEDKRRFIVERISIRGAKVTMTAPGLKGQGVTFDLPEVQMRDVGKKQDGLRASEIANLVVRELISKIAQRVLTSIDLIRKGGASGALDALKGILK